MSSSKAHALLISSSLACENDLLCPLDIGSCGYFCARLLLAEALQVSITSTGPPPFGGGLHLASFDPGWDLVTRLGQHWRADPLRPHFVILIISNSVVRNFDMWNLKGGPKGWIHHGVQKVKKATYISVKFVRVVLREAFPCGFCAYSFYKLITLFVEIGSAYAATGTIVPPQVTASTVVWWVFLVRYGVAHFFHDLHEAQRHFRKLSNLIYGAYVVSICVLRKLWASVDKFRRGVLSSLRNRFRFGRKKS